ncbi:MAG: phage major capsid protein [Mycobacterium sp.]|nr:phage major capsid protein [Mycobacterium sp.]
MPQLGTGIIPAAGPIAAELTSVVRRGFMPRVYVQIWRSAPMIAAMLSSAQVASGGISPITAPVQGAPMVRGQWVDYSGAFNQPGVQPGIQNAEFNLKAFVTPIPFLGFEGLVQLDYSIVPLIDARMNDATNVTIDVFATTLFDNVANQQQLIGLPAAVDDGTFAVIYGGINRLANTFWKSTYVHNPGNVTPTRNLMLQYIAQVSKTTGEMPQIGIMGFGTWTLLAQDFTPQERYMINPGDRLDASADFVGHSSFQALDIAGIPFYADPYCPEGTLYLLNTNYLSLFLHERAAFSFTGFESTLPNNQFGYISAILSLLELVNVKPKCHAKIDGLQFLII